ncbi:MAG TPA: TRAP transporter small permease subunit [Alphaproteobacteria bacterium]|nr:TRAP transporter small permease subunit [Alphaproteobacteria bacterium]
MSALALFARFIDALNDRIGRAVSWLTIGVVLICFTVVVLRYAFSTGFVWMQDLYVWFHAAAFTIGASYALRHEHHVRVDIFYRAAGDRYKAWVNLLGCAIFILPLVYVVTYYGWSYVGRSWAIREGSSNVGGMPGLFLIKSCILVFVWLVGLQALSMMARSVLIIAGRKDLVTSDVDETLSEV